MGALAAADIVSIWELGRHRPDWRKALIALGPALPRARPSELAALMDADDPAVAKRITEALFSMRKIDIDALRRAKAGASAPR